MVDIAHHKKSPALVRAFRADPARTLAMLSKCPVHSVTPIRRLDALAQKLGLARIMAKDESCRMRLGSFKALGGTFAVAQMICDAAGVENPMDAPEIAAGMTFVCASAGNHGLSVAAGARVFGAKAASILPETAPLAFASRIRAKGAEVISGGSYEDCADDAKRLANERGWLLLSDSSWPGYTERPALVLEGYTVLAEECREVFERENAWPTHVFLQAGVGGLAAAVAAHIRVHWALQPQIIIVEPDRAACLRESVKAGRLTPGNGPVSNMGRLDCKEASMIAFDALRHDADTFVTITDAAASAAVDLLAQYNIATTPSGAAGLAAVIEMHLGSTDRVMIIVTEGPENG